MKFLIITHTYAPDLNPRAFRWECISEELATCGHEVHVLCATESKDTRTKPGLTIHRVKDPLASRFRPLANPSQIDGSYTTPKKIKALITRVAKWVWKRLHWPDYAMGWVLAGSREAKSLCSKNAYDWVISSSNPFSGHVVALRSKKHMGTARWLIDIGDPYSQMESPSPYNRFLFQRLSQRTERFILDQADLITVTTHKTAEAFHLAHGGLTHKMMVIPPLLSLPTTPPSTRQDKNTIRLLYIGTLYKSIRNPAFLLACISQLNQRHPDLNLELHFYGSIGDCQSELSNLPIEIQNKIFVHGLAPRERVLQEMVNADVLVNIGNATETQLPSKIVEYIAVGKPILNLTCVDLDASERILSRYPALFSIRQFGQQARASDIDEMADFLRDLPVVSTALSRDLTAPFTRHCITHSYLQGMARSDSVAR